jgi:catechol 2,3-dioxygenase-like lactoylglutathione lyase family enzyme
MDNEVTLDFSNADRDIAPQHYAFLVSEMEFDEILGRIRQRGLPFWADPHHHRANEINTTDGGRRAYFEDPSGHNLEIMTRPYGEA